MLGCRVDPLGREAAIERIVALARSAGPALVVTLGTEMVMRARRDPRFRATLDGAALSLCDTIGVALAARRRGEPLPERVNGVE